MQTANLVQGRVQGAGRDGAVSMAAWWQIRQSFPEEKTSNLRQKGELEFEQQGEGRGNDSREKRWSLALCEAGKKPLEQECFTAWHAQKASWRRWRLSWVLQDGYVFISI